MLKASKNSRGAFGAVKIPCTPIFFIFAAFLTYILSKIALCNEKTQKFSKTAPFSGASPQNSCNSPHPLGSGGNESPILGWRYLIKSLGIFEISDLNKVILILSNYSLVMLSLIRRNGQRCLNCTLKLHFSLIQYHFGRFEARSVAQYPISGVAKTEKPPFRHPLDIIGVAPPSLATPHSRPCPSGQNPATLTHS